MNTQDSPVKNALPATWDGNISLPFLPKQQSWCYITLGRSSACLAARQGAAAPTSADTAVSPRAPFHMASPDSRRFGKTPRTFYKTLFEGCRRFPPAAQCTRSPLMLSIVSAPTCLKFLRDPDILQWYFNNSLIIAPDNNLHCMETSCAGGGWEGLPWKQGKNHTTKRHERTRADLFTPCTEIHGKR